MPGGARPGAGRPKGAKNKVSLEVADKLAAWGFDPFRGMFELATDPQNSPELRGKMCSELAQYVAPKRKAVEHSGPEGGAIEHAIDLSARQAMQSVAELMRHLAKKKTEAV
jgi:hypothetical protein